MYFILYVDDEEAPYGFRFHSPPGLSSLFVDCVIAVFVILFPSIHTIRSHHWQVRSGWLGGRRVPDEYVTCLLIVGNIFPGGFHLIPPFFELSLEFYIGYE